MTEHEILTAAEALEARGERASIRKVRAELGGGDPNTIARTLKVRRENGVAATQETPPDVPDAVLRALSAWAGQIASTSAAEASVALTTAGEDNEALLGQVDALQKQVAALQAELETVKNEAAATAGQLKAALDAVERTAGERDAAHAEADRLGKRLAAMETKIAAAEAAQAEIDALRGENKSLIARASGAEARVEAAEAKTAAAEACKAELESELDGVLAENKELVARVYTAESRQAVTDDLRQATLELLKTAAARADKLLELYNAAVGQNGGSGEGAKKKSAKAKAGKKVQAETGVDAGQEIMVMTDPPSLNLFEAN